MEYRKFNNSYVIRIDKGEEVIAQLQVLCQKENITLGNISGLGATNYIEVGLFDVSEKKYHKTTIEKPLEITSLVGNISRKDNEVYLHLHINVSDIDCNTYGGHLNKCIVSATCEIIINEIDGKMERYFDEEIGLNLYKFEGVV